MEKLTEEQRDTICGHLQTIMTSIHIGDNYGRSILCKIDVTNHMIDITDRANCIIISIDCDAIDMAL